MHLHQRPATCTFINALQDAPSSTPCKMHLHQRPARCTFINTLQHAPSSTSQSERQIQHENKPSEFHKSLGIR
jgi:hypothetical protein